MKTSEKSEIGIIMKTKKIFMKFWRIFENSEEILKKFVEKLDQMSGKINMK